MNYEDRVREYHEYIHNHRNNVQRAWDIINIATTRYRLNSWRQQNSGNAHNIIDKLIKKHDLSKYSSAEFEGYRQKFYPAEGESIDEKKFEEAWEHHKSKNLQIGRAHV